MDWVAIDFETATGSRASACALGLVTVIDGVVCERRSWLIRPPDNTYAPYNTYIHGITPAMTADRGSFGELWSEVGPYLDGTLVVAHNASFDMSVLRASLDVAGLRYPDLSYLCTLALSRAAYRDLASHTLPIVAHHCGIEVNHHDPGSDAHGAACIAMHMCAQAGDSDLFMMARRLGVEPGEMRDDWYLPCAGARTSRERVRAIGHAYDDGSPQPQSLAGYTFVLTGGLDHYSRAEAEAVLRAYGARTSSSVSRKTDYVVVGVAPGSKYTKALELGVRVMNEADLDEMLASGELPQ